MRTVILVRPAAIADWAAVLAFLACFRARARVRG